MEQERDFKGVWISKEIWLDERLTAIEKIILVEIDSLDCGEKGCYASNEHLANFCQCSITKVSGAISKLIKLGYIYVESFNGRQRVLKSRLTKNVRQDYKNCNAELQNLKESNIYNNKDNNINNKYIVILEYLNEKTGANFRPIDTNLKLIKARMQDYTEQDLKNVIDKKVKEWKGTEMQQYLRPKTLFNATNFENYVNSLENLSTNKNNFIHNNYTNKQISNLISDLDNTEV